MALITKLNQIAQAIGRKTGQPASTYNIDNMASAIDEIQTDFPVVPPTPIEDESVDMIQFIDYDGTIVAQFAVEDASEITQLPEVPTHQGLTATGWTATLAQVQGATHAMIVGAQYENAEDPTQTILQILPYSGQTITLNLGQTAANAVTIDWGDGSATETSATVGNFTVTHTYTDVSNAPFEIKLTPAEGETLSLGHGADAKRLFNNTDTSEGNFRLPIIAVVGRTTQVKAHAFKNCDGLQGITLPNSGLMSETPQHAFYACRNLNTLILPNSVTKITGDTQATSSSSRYQYGSMMYLYCRNIVIPSSVTSIGKGAFIGSHIQTLILPDSITSIQDEAFRDCRIVNLRLPNNSSLNIGSKAFMLNRELTKLIIPQYGTINTYAFSRCQSLKSVVCEKSTFPGYLFVPNNYNGESYQTGYNDQYVPLSKVTISPNTTTLNAAFHGCIALESVDIPNTVTSMSGYVFYNCWSLKTITIPSSVTSFTSTDYMFCECHNLKSVTFLNSPTTLGSYMFYNCWSLKTINIPDTVTTIGNNAFKGCMSLQSITIPSATTTLGAAAFFLCGNLTEVKFKDRTSIPSTFAASSIFNSATNPGSVTTLDFTEQTTVPTFDGTFFTNMPSYVKIKVPAALEAEWKATTGWDTYANQIVGVSE